MDEQVPETTEKVEVEPKFRFAGAMSQVSSDVEELRDEFESFKTETASNFQEIGEAIKLIAEYVGKYRGELQVHLDTPDAHHPALTGKKA
jgi:hypothetical protein